MNKTILEEQVCQGLSTYEIAKVLNTSQTNIRYWLKKFQLKTNKRKRIQKNIYAYQKDRGFERKKKLVELKGGKCEICGYSKNYSALQFHHLDPKEKEAQLDSRKLSNSKWEWCLMEVEKCQLLCANCHSEIHHPHLTVL